MTVAIRAPGSARRVRSRKTDPAVSIPKVTSLDSRKLIAVPPPEGDPTVKVLPKLGNAPPWVRSLLSLQRSTSVLTLLLVGACLSVYGWTVYSQQMWSRESRTLETLRRQEQQLATANEILKHQMAQQAERPGTGLVPPDPSRVIFLEPAPARPPKATYNAKPAASEDRSSPKPLGY